MHQPVLFQCYATMGNSYVVCMLLTEMAQTNAPPPPPPPPRDLWIPLTKGEKCWMFFAGHVHVEDQKLTIYVSADVQN